MRETGREASPAEAARMAVRPLLDEAALAARVDALAGEVAAAFPGEFTMLVVLKGAFVFAADLVRALDRHGRAPQVAFVTLSSYGAGAVSSGIVEVVGGFPAELAGRDVLLVDDIADSGRTLAFATEELRQRGAGLVRVATLLDKPARREVAFAVDFVGFEIADHFVVGYGIDYAQRFRHLPFVGIVEA